MVNVKYQKILYNSVLAIFPVLLAITGILFYKTLGAYYIRAIDPEYLYLFNGLTLAQFKFYLGHVDNPGTPLQVLIAITIWIVSIFKEGDGIVNKVISDPETYMQAIFFGILLICVVSLFLVGKIASMIHGLWAGVFIQFMPFATNQYIATIERIRPETMQLFTLSMLIILLLIYLENQKIKLKPKKFYFLLAVTIAFGTALKLSFALMALLPLFIIDSNKVKLKYFGTVIILFFILAFPVMFRFNLFYKWVTGLIVHSGHYGHGEANFVDLPSFFSNLLLLIRNYRVFFNIQVLVFIFIIAWYIYLKKYLPESGKYIKVLTGILVTCIVQVLIISKHYSLHYFVPYNLLHVFELYLIISIFISAINTKYKKFAAVLYVIALLLLSNNQAGLIIREYKNQVKKKAIVMNTVNEIEKTKKQETLFLYWEGYGDPYKEFALWAGYLWTGRYRDHFKKELQKVYPDTYIYDPWNKKFISWNDEIDKGQLSEKIKKETTVFIGKDDPETKELVIDKLNDVFAPDTVSLKLKYRNEEKNEAIYQIIL